MNSYIVNFITYSFAMVGFLLTVLFIYKKSVNITEGQNKKNFLQVETSLRISPVKTIYVIKAGNEKFLIAGDTANTTMLAKLENNITDEFETEEQIKEANSVVEFAPLRKLLKIGRS